ncbi:transcription factor subunit Med10 of mediator complex-domain-containing protein [Microdochium bolleyi]|uniref:Mediator of RNA polymerase II transcription subunit 10 n=1 Tax=Microdochium bolleyi TaxID=196109 RepID=A0A136JC86_9PEZI|nr:transcription factor subunit Med10 of mediator complex-domain-containing protein [Microdochium bolleyi]
MAPAGRMGAADHDVIEQQLKETVQSLYQILVQVSAYDQHTSVSSGSNSTSAAPGAAANSTPTPTSQLSSSSSKPSAEVLAQELRTLSASLQAIHATASHPTPERSLPHIPPELVQYVENGRNPDIYTREFVEQVRRGNQLLRGKQVAFGRFRDILAGEMDSAMPELHDDVATVLEATGGRDRWKDTAPGGGGGAGASGANGTGAGASSSFGQGSSGNGGSAATPSGRALSGTPAP